METFSMRAIGLMSGTSLDGLDLAHVAFRSARKGWNFELLDSAFFPYDKDWRERLSTAHLLSGYDLARLDVAFGRYMGELVNRFVQQNRQASVDLVASHGHTVFHEPERGLTKQIGCGAALAAATGITTVSDFRSLDVALGGQGAPLVPIGDRLLFSGYDACLNLGGFSNISFEQNGQRVAFDICPVNIVMNSLAERLGQAFDKDGLLARSGCVNDALLKTLNALPIYHLSTRPSLAREWVEKEFQPLLQDLPTEDLLRTVLEHVAVQVAAVLNTHLPQGTLLVTGGGAYNTFLLERLRILTTTEVTVPRSDLVDMKESIVFAFLGVLRLRGEVNVLRSVTGASSDCCAGVVHHSTIAE